MQIDWVGIERIVDSLSTLLNEYNINSKITPKQVDKLNKKTISGTSSIEVQKFSDQLSDAVIHNCCMELFNKILPYKDKKLKFVIFSEIAPFPTKVFNRKNISVRVFCARHTNRIFTIDSVTRGYNYKDFIVLDFLFKIS